MSISKDFKELGQVEYEDYIQKLYDEHGKCYLSILKDVGDHYLVEEYGNHLDIRYSIYIKGYYFDGDENKYITSPILAFCSYDKKLAEEEFDYYTNYQLQPCLNDIKACLRDIYGEDLLDDGELLFK